MEARIVLTYDYSKEAKAVSEAVAPDNIRTPRNLRVETTRTRSRVITSIRYDGDNLMTFLSTIDDLLSCISVAEKSFSLIKRLK